MELSSANGASGSLEVDRRGARQRRRFAARVVAKAQNGRATVNLFCDVTIAGNAQPIPSLARNGAVVDPSSPLVIEETVTLDLPFPVPSGDLRVGCTGSGTDSSALVVNAGDGTLPISSTTPSVATCTPTPTVICAEGNRFSISVDVRGPDGRVVAGQVNPRDRFSDGGWFSSPDPARVELLVQIINSCSRNSLYWVFMDGRTNAEVTVSITDTSKGVTKTYFNPQNTPFVPVQDPTAFATCP